LGIFFAPWIKTQETGMKTITSDKKTGCDTGRQPVSCVPKYPLAETPMGT
jgi:hypothetical protein